MDKQQQKVLRELGLTISKWRKHKKLSQRELAADAEIARTQLSRIENGEINFSIFTLVKIASGLEVTISELFRGSPRWKK